MVVVVAPERRYSNSTGVRSWVASQKTSNDGSSALSRGWAMSRALTSSGTPRAVSLRTASVVASASRACSQTRVARPITAASSAVSEMSGSANSSGRIR